ncbi:MAG: membrane protein required for colicin V production [Maritalea sp.]|jgi:membrane protein required for colicin V production
MLSQLGNDLIAALPEDLEDMVGETLRGRSDTPTEPVVEGTDQMEEELPSETST